MTVGDVGSTRIKHVDKLQLSNTAK